MKLVNKAMASSVGTSSDRQQSAPSKSERDRLILEHMEQVQLIARRIHDRLPQSVNLEDLVSAGILGLISAIDNYDARQSVKLRTYAEYKIKGAMLDSLRGLDWAPRLHRKRARDIETTVAVLEQSLQRKPSDEEIANYLGVPLLEYHVWLSEVRGLTVASLDSPKHADGDDRRFSLELADAATKSPSQIAEKAELETLLSSALQQMPDLQRTVLNLYYFEELTLRQISSRTGLHESRISQLKSQGIEQLRSHLRAG